MSHWSEKDGRLSFETQLKIKFLPLNSSSDRVLFNFPKMICEFSELKQSQTELG